MTGQTENAAVTWSTIRTPLYFSADVCKILDVTRERLCALETDIETGRRKRWRMRSVLHVFRLHLADQLCSFGVRTREAVRITQRVGSTYVEQPAYPNHATLEEQLGAAVTGALVVYRDSTGWHGYHCQSWRALLDSGATRWPCIVVEIAAVIALFAQRLPTPAPDSSRAIDARRDHQVTHQQQ